MAKKRAKPKVVKAKVVKVPARKAKRMSKGAELPWEVWCLRLDGDRHEYLESFATRAKAERNIGKDPDLAAPVIIHIDIPPMEY